MNIENELSNYLIVAFGVIATYLSAAIVKHVLDRRMKKYRFDNYLLYLLVAKTPYVSTKLILQSKNEPKIEEIKKALEGQFAFEMNDMPASNSYSFKIRQHPTAMKISIIEPIDEGKYTIVLQTIGDDKLNKIGESSFQNTINYFEKITRILKTLKLAAITAQIKMSFKLQAPEEIDSTYSLKNGTTISSKTINISTTSFTEIQPLVKECLTFWRNKFI